jgi:DNA-binding Lrp family transcriptional regulator
MPQLDYIDKQMLFMLGNDCRTSYREIAKALGLSATSIKSRVDDLTAQGILVGFHVEFAPAMIGSEYLLVWLKTDDIQDTEQFISEIAANRGIMQIISIYGGEFMIVAEYTNSFELANLTEAFRSNPHIVSTDIHPLLSSRGKKIDLTNLQLRVLKALLKDARMPISDIASETGLTVRLVRKTLRELRQSEAINFTLSWRLNVGDRVTFMLKLRWDPKKVSREQIMDVMMKRYQDVFWEILPSASDPFLVSPATVDSMNDVNTITANLKSYPGVLYSEAFIFRPSYRYKSIKRLCLEETVQSGKV